MKAATRHNRKTAVRREQIATAALELVAAGGPRALRMSALARRVGLTPSALYRHFPSKDEVLVAALDRFRGLALDTIRGVCDETPSALDRLGLLLRRMGGLLRTNATIMPRMAFADEGPGIGRIGRDHAASVLGDVLAAVAEVVRDGQRRGEIRRDIPADTAALMVFGIIQPAGIVCHLRRGKFDVDRHVSIAWRTLRRALVAMPRRRRR